MWQTVLVAAWLLEAASLQITGYGDTTADYGEDARYKCELRNQSGVLQVTWQKRLRDDSIENVASYSKWHGQQINQPYQGKVMLTETSLSSASITLKNLTWADESCYICLFNVYPEGSKTKQTCLRVQGISQVQTKVSRPSSGLADGTMPVMFSCSATGKPAPTIRWLFSQGDTSLHEPVAATVANGDHTFTSSSNVTLIVSRGWKGHADCVVDSGSRGQRMKRIPFSWDADLGEGGAGGAMTPTDQALLTVGIVAVMAFIATIAIVGTIQRREKAYRRTPDVEVEVVTFPANE
ncbi:OX-2 membrane glycoprotein-like isoform X2 [Dunckerocampus dactyliophorus]|nr:OX-2 membrane glycoprotein-like isoform X2 [Dunckerocampus dactyliophorus]